jgi:hypothetical protein
MSKVECSTFDFHPLCCIARIPALDLSPNARPHFYSPRHATLARSPAQHARCRKI